MLQIVAHAKSPIGRTPGEVWERRRGHHGNPTDARMKVLFGLVIFGLVAGILLSIEAGYQIGLRRRAHLPAGVRGVSPTLEASVFGLMGLLIAFTFYGAGARFDIRRNLVAQEANTIGTAYLRLDLLPEEAQPALRDVFREYLRSRLAVYQAIPDIKAVKAALERSAALQSKVWSDAVDAARGSGPAEKTLVLSSLNEMIDITTIRTVALITHPPAGVFALLVLTVIVSSALAGYTVSASGIRDWVSPIAFALVLGAAIYVILDYEFPRMGLVRVDSVDQVLAETLKKMD